MKKALLFLLCIVFGISTVNADKCPESYEYVYQNGERCCFHNSEPNFGELTLDSTTCYDDKSIACPTGICSGGHRLALAEIQNRGKDCWYKCNSKQGPCSWCGSAGMCCKKGFNDKSNGCDGTFGGSTQHECVLSAESCIRGSNSYDQDYTVLNKVYNQIDGWRANKGVPALRRDLELEKIAQSAGFIWRHCQHEKQNRLAKAMAKRKCDWKYGGGLYSIIVCGCSPNDREPRSCPRNGCRYADMQLEKPAENWKSHEYKTPHYNVTIKSQNQIIGCSAIKKWVGDDERYDDYGYSIWCILMGPLEGTVNGKVYVQPKCY